MNRGRAIKAIWTAGLLAVMVFALACADKSQLARVQTTTADEALARGSFQQALDTYDRVLELDPGQLVHVGRARALIGLRRYREAVTGLRRAIELEADLGEAHLLLGEVLTAVGEYAAARDALTRAAAVSPDALPPAYHLVVAELGQLGFLREPPPPGLPTVALQSYLDEAALRERPLPAALAASIESLLAAHSLDPRVRPLRRLLATHHLVVARGHREGGDFAAAVGAYKRCAAVDPGVMTHEGAIASAYEYDMAGNLVRAVAPDGAATRYAYDAIDRLTGIEYPAGNQVDFEYTSSSKLFRITDASGATVYSYDRLGRLRSTRFPNGQEVDLTRDAGGNVTAMVYPGGGEVVYEYAAGGALAGLTDVSGKSFFSYNKAGDLVSWVRPNGIETEYRYDGAGRVEGVVHHRDGETVLAFTYVLDGVGRPLERRQTGTAGTLTTRFRYDGGGRLLEERCSDGYRAEYTYDHSGNRLLRAVGSDTTRYVYGRDNRLLIAGDQVFDYDTAGNVAARLTPDGVTRYDYDGAGQLVRVYGDGRVTDFGYRGDGTPWSRVSGGRPVFFVTDQGGRVIAEVDGAGGQINAFAYGPTRLGEAGLHYLYDYPGGSVVATIAGDGRVVSDFRIDAFGLVQAGTQARSRNGFRGGRWEADLGLVYLDGRFYDPDLGRFLTPASTAGVNLARHHNEYAELGFILGKHRATAALQTAAAWGSRSDPVATAVAEAIVGDYRAPLRLPAPRPASPRLDDLLKDPRLPPVLAPEVRRLWGDRIGNPGMARFAVRLPGAARAEGPLLLAAASIASEHIGRRWNWQPGEPRGPSVAGAVGGLQQLRIGEVAGELRDYFGEITRVTSVLFDQDGGQLIFSGDAEPESEPLKLDDFVVALRAIYVLRQDPAVSIGTEPSGLPEYKKVRYDGGTANTSFGQTMFAADYALKTLSIGRDSTRTPVHLPVEGFKSVVDWTVELDELVLGMQWNSRVWFVPGRVDIRKRSDGHGILVGDIPVVTLSESRFYRRSLRQRGVETFAGFLTEHFDSLAVTYPVVRKLPQLAQLVAVAKWMRDHRIPIDAGWVEEYELEWVETPTVVRAVASRRNATGPTGPVVFEMEGGVSFREPNAYGLATEQVERVEAQVLETRPTTTGAATWSFQAGERTAQAVAMPVRGTRRDGVLRFSQTDISGAASSPSLVRYYSSFDRRREPLGNGWSLVPYHLELRRELVGAPGESSQPDLGDRVVLVDRATGTTQPYEIISEFAPDSAQPTLRLNMDGSLSLVGATAARVDFDARGRLRAVFDRQGKSVRYRFEGSRLLAVEGERGEAIFLEYDVAGLLAVARDGRGHRVEYVYDERGNLIQVSDAAGRRVSYEYDAAHRLVGWAWGETAGMRASYDQFGRVTEFVDAGGAARRFDYGQPGETIVFDDLGNATTNRYDGDGRLRGKGTATGELVMELAADGTVATLTSSAGARVDLSYDYRGNLVELRDPLGGRFDFAYGEAGLASVTGPGGLQRRFTYDEAGNLVAIMDDAAQTTLEYNGDGRLTGVDGGIGGPLRISRAEDGLVVGVGTTGGGSLQLERSLVGSPAAVVDGVGRRADFSHDAAERLVGLESAAGAFTYTYHQSGGLGSIAGPDGATTRIDYDGGRASAIEFGDGGRLELDYAADGRLGAVAGPGNRRLEYEYDAGGRVKRVTSVVAAE